MVQQADPWAEFRTGEPAQGAPTLTRITPPAPPPLQTPLQEENDRLQNQNLSLQIAERERARVAAEEQRRNYEEGIAAAQAEMREVIRAARRARTRSSTGWFQTGFGADWIGSNTSEGRSLRGDLDVIGANTAFNKLAEMRRQSPTGTALGNVTERELDLLRNSVASLDPGQSDADFQRNMDTIIERYNNMLTRLGADPEGDDNSPARDQNAVVSTPPVPPGHGIAFWDDPQRPVPPGGEEFQRDLQERLFQGVFSTPEEIIAFGAGRGFNIDRGQAERAIQAMGRGVAPQVNTPQFERPDIEDQRGSEAAINTQAPQRTPLEIFGATNEDVDAFVRGSADVLTAGGADELSAIGDTVFNGGTYAENLWRQREIDDYDTQFNPVSRMSGQVAGAFAIPTGVSSAAFRGAGRAYAGGATRDAVRIAARRAGIRRLGAEGAAYSGAYGAGSADGDLTDRLTSGAFSAGAGGATALGLGSIGSRIIERYGRRGENPRLSDQLRGAEAADAAGELDINLLPADVGGPMTRRLTAAFAQTPFGAGPIIRGAQRTEQEAGDALSGIARAEGAPQRQEVFGETAQRAANRYVEESGEIGKGYYSDARNLSGDAMVQAPRAFRNINAQLREIRATAPVEGELPAALERFRSVIAGDQGLHSLDIDSIRRLRTAVASEARSEGLRGTDYKRRVGMVLDDLREDIASQLPPEAATAFRRADDNWRQRLDTIDNVIEEVIGPAGDRSAESVARRLISMSRGDSLRFQRFIDDIPEDEARIIRGSVIQDLGRARNNQQNAASDAFSIETFLTNWAQLPDRSKNTLFRGQSRQAIEELAEVAEAVRGTRRFANTSNSGGAINVSERARALSYGAAWFTMGLSIAAENLTGRALASPVLTRWLARRPQNPAAARAHVARLSDIARTQPAIAGEVLGLQQALMRQLQGGTVSRAAASPDSESDQ